MPLTPVVDSNIGLTDPSEQIRKNIELAMQVSQNQERSQLQNAQILEHQAKAQAAAQKAAADAAFQAEMTAFSQSPTKDSAYALVAKYSDRVGEPFKQVVENLAQKDKNAIANQSLAVVLPLLNDNPALAKRMGEEHAKSLDNAGKTEDAKKYRETLALIDTDQGSVIGMLSGPGIAAMGDKNWAEATKNTKAEFRRQEFLRREAESKALVQEKTGLPAALANIRQSESAAGAADARAAYDKSQKDTEDLLRPGKGLVQDLGIAEKLRAAELNLPEREMKAKESAAETAKQNAELAKRVEDRQEGKIPAEANRTLTELTKRIEEGKLSRDLSLKAAGEFDKIRGLAASGTLSNIAQAVRTVWGSQDSITRARQLHNEVAVSKVADVLKAFKPASDSDMAVAMKPIPLDNSDPAYLAKYHRGLAQLRDAQINVDDVAKQYISRVKGTGTNIDKTFTIKGIEVTPGMTLEDVQDRAAVKFLGLKEPGASAGEPASNTLSRLEAAKAYLKKLEGKNGGK